MDTLKARLALVNCARWQQEGSADN